MVRRQGKAEGASRGLDTTPWWAGVSAGLRAGEGWRSVWETQVWRPGTLSAVLAALGDPEPAQC